MNSPQQLYKQIKIFGTIVKHFHETVIACGFPEIAKKVDQWDIMKLMTNFIAVAEPMKCGLKVLNHGDSWLNNIMFKIDENGKSVDMKYIDFQISFWGSPSNDLGYLFASSIKDDVKVEHFDDMIVYYHEELTGALEKLNYEKHIPTISELHVDMIEKSAGCTIFLNVNSFFNLLNFF